MLACLIAACCGASPSQLVADYHKCAPAPDGSCFAGAESSRMLVSKGVLDPDGLACEGFLHWTLSDGACTGPEECAQDGTRLPGCCLRWPSTVTTAA